MAALGRDPLGGDITHRVHGTPGNPQRGSCLADTRLDGKTPGTKAPGRSLVTPGDGCSGAREAGKSPPTGSFRGCREHGLQGHGKSKWARRSLVAPRHSVTGLGTAPLSQLFYTPKNVHKSTRNMPRTGPKKDAGSIPILTRKPCLCISSLQFWRRHGGRCGLQGEAVKRMGDLSRNKPA